MALRKDSWKYPLETLDGNKPEVLALGEWLARVKPRMTRQNGDGMSRRLRQGWPFKSADAAKIMGIAGANGLADKFVTGLADELLTLLNAVHASYVPERAKRAAYERELKRMRDMIPVADMDRMRPIAGLAHWLDGPDKSLCKLGIAGCKIWLAMSEADRRSWFVRVERIISETQARHMRETDEIFRRLDRDRRANEDARKAKSDEDHRKWKAQWDAKFKDFAKEYVSMATGDHAALGLSSGATDKEIKSAYRALVKQHHPDAGGDAEAFKRVQSAYDRLMVARK